MSLTLCHLAVFSSNFATHTEQKANQPTHTEQKANQPTHTEQKAYEPIQFSKIDLVEKVSENGD